jgi:hypothetical protein
LSGQGKIEFWHVKPLQGSDESCIEPYEEKQETANQPGIKQFLKKKTDRENPLSPKKKKKCSDQETSPSNPSGTKVKQETDALNPDEAMVLAKKRQRSAKKSPSPTKPHKKPTPSENQPSIKSYFKSEPNP